MENSNLPDEGIESHLVNGKLEQASLKTSNTPGSQNQHEDFSQSEDSEDIEDVKVCDICGDAGLEELLAICSRCSDGAEHTYCMQKKLKELPEGDWLCEECKFKEETGNQNADKSETEAEPLKVQPSTKNNHYTKSDFDPEYLPELDTKVLNSEEREARDRPQSQKISTKREQDSLEVDLKTSKRVLESSGVSSRRDDTKNKSFLLREDLFSSLVADKAKQVKQVLSCGGQSVNNSSLARSQTFSGPNTSKIFDPLLSSRGPLSKSGSFNNTNTKHKVQFIDNIPPPKQNMGRHSIDTRKGHAKKMSESAPMKSNRSGCFNAESTTKLQSLQPSLAEDHRGLKERTMAAKKVAIAESPLANYAPAANVGNLHPRADPEGGILSESKVLDISKGSHNRDCSGCNEVKSSHASKSFGCSSSILVVPKPFQTIPKEDIHEMSGDASSHLTSPQVVGLSQGNDKIKDRASLGILKQPAPGVSGLLRCKKCNETGHPTQFCSIDKLPVTALKHSADQNVRDRHNKNSKTKDDADALILRSTIQKDTGFPNHADKLSMPGVNLSNEVPSKDFGCSSSSYLRNSTQFERKTYGRATLRSSIADPTKSTSVDVNPNAVQVEASYAPEEDNLNPTVAISDPLYMARLPQILPNTGCVPIDMLKSTAIPELEFIWQGGFEVLRSGRLFKSCEGVQAHLSTFASPKVFEAATKFPGKVQLEEVTYLSSWPREYWGHSPGEHNIGLFFFAKDVESYEKNYSKLLEDMIKNDLALKGNIAGADLLVFPSNKLPQNSQRWNRLFFLWGVFRGKMPNFLKTKPQLEEKPSKASLNSEMLAQDLPIPIPEVSVSQKLNYNEILSKETFICEQSTRMDANLPSVGVENRVACLNNFDLEGREGIPLHLKEKMEEKGNFMKSEELTDLSPSRKHSIPIPIETFSRAGGTIDLNEADFPPLEDRREHKKMKPENRVHGCSYQDKNSSHSLSSNVYPHLFPMELGAVRDMKQNKVIRCSDGEGFQDIPNLELALGATTKLPEDKISSMPSINPGDDMAASLDLFLAFRSTEKEPNVFTSI